MHDPRRHHLTVRTAAGIHGGIDVSCPSDPARADRECRDAAHCARRRSCFHLFRVACRSGVRLGPGSGSGGSAWQTGQAAVCSRSSLLGGHRHFAWRGRDTGDIARRHHVAGEHRAANAVLGRDDSRDHELSARRSSLGSAVGTAGREPGGSGASDCAGNRAWRRSTRDSHRTDCADFTVGHRLAERVGAVRACRAVGCGGAGTGRRFSSRANDSCWQWYRWPVRSPSCACAFLAGLCLAP